MLTLNMMTIEKDINNIYARYKDSVESAKELPPGDERASVVENLRQILTKIICAVALVEKKRSDVAYEKVEEVNDMLKSLELVI